MIIGFDYGTKRLGVALSDDTEKIAVATSPIVYKEENELFRNIAALFNKYNPSFIIIGIPLGYDDKPTQMSENVKKFANSIKTQFNKEVVLWNEVMTSIAASQFVKKDKSGKLDSESARIILQEYLDFKNL